MQFYSPKKSSLFSSFIVFRFVVFANASLNYRLVKLITFVSSVSLSDFSLFSIFFCIPLHPVPSPRRNNVSEKKGPFDVSRKSFVFFFSSTCWVVRVKLHVPPIRAQREHCFILRSTVPSEMDYSRGFVLFGFQTDRGHFFLLHALLRLVLITYQHGQTDGFEKKKAFPLSDAYLLIFQTSCEPKSSSAFCPLLTGQTGSNCFLVTETSERLGLGFFFSKSKNTLLYTRPDNEQERF